MKWHPSDPSEACVRENTAGFPYEAFGCLYPAYGKTLLPFEANVDNVPVRDWMTRHPWVPILAVVLYGLFIVKGQAYFQNRPAWNWRRTMALWNLGLSLFSIIGLFRTLPALTHMYTHYTWHENFCFDPESHYGSDATGFWVQLFVLSKFPELLDTFFIVIHKKKLIFLHWYHHISVLLYCWHSYVSKAPVGIIFCVMNYSVHALMYFYYFLMAVHAKPKWFNALYITIAQISQMMVGVAVTVAGWYLMIFEQKECGLNRDNNLAALVMYGSYLFLFLQFFFQRYFSKKSVVKSKTTTTVNGSQKTRANGKIKPMKEE